MKLITWKGTLQLKDCPANEVSMATVEDIIAWIEEHKIGIVVHGDDYSLEQIEHIYKIPISMGIFRTVPYTPTISTTEIIRRCQEAKTAQS